MNPELKAIVFKTKHLRETEEFFKQLGLTVTESSARHFVVQERDVRILFMHTQNSLQPEMYFAAKDSSDTTNKPIVFKDPNDIKIIITHEKSNHHTHL